MEVAREICKEMLEQRGYTIVDENEYYITVNKKDGEPACIFFCTSSKFNVDKLKEYISAMNEMNITHSIIVYSGVITTYVQKIIDTSDMLRIELFNCEDLQFNITKHRLQPLFEKLDEQDGENFKKKWGKFGTLKIEDPISKFYNYSKGDVIRVIRKDNTISYRIVR
jgi:DNA-directed RNA polymerases I, II, and III subunit RPABC1